MLQTFNCTRIVIIFFSRPILSIFQNYISTTIACSFLLLGATLKKHCCNAFFMQCKKITIKCSSNKFQRFSIFKSRKLHLKVLVRKKNRQKIECQKKSIIAAYVSPKQAWKYHTHPQTCVIKEITNTILKAWIFVMLMWMSDFKSLSSSNS